MCRFSLLGHAQGVVNFRRCIETYSDGETVLGEKRSPLSSNQGPVRLHEIYDPFTLISPRLLKQGDAFEELLSSEKWFAAVPDELDILLLLAEEVDGCPKCFRVHHEMCGTMRFQQGVHVAVATVDVACPIQRLDDGNTQGEVHRSLLLVCQVFEEQNLMRKYRKKPILSIFEIKKK